MNMKKRIFCILTILLVFCLAVCGCGKGKQEDVPVSSSDSETDAKELSGQLNTLTIAGDPVASLNPLLNKDTDLTRLIFSGLLKYDASGNLIGDLAESYCYDEETLTYTFDLREGILWQDGELLTADDVVYTYNLLTQDETLDTDIKSDYENIASAEADGPYRVRITVKENCPFMLSYFTVGILPKNLLEGEQINATAFNTAPVGTGEYRLTSWNETQIILEQNEFYYGEKSAVKKIVYEMVSDSSQRARLLEEGKIQITALDPGEAAKFSEGGDYMLCAFDTSVFYGLFADYKSDFWKENADSLSAFNALIDKKDLIKNGLNGLGTAAYSPLQAFGISSADETAHSEENFALAMKKLGWKKDKEGIYTRGGQAFSFTLQVLKEDAVSQKLARLLQEQFQKAGIILQIEIVPELSWDQTYDGAISAFAVSGSPDALYKYFVTDASGNFMHYSNPAVDGLLKKARYETDSKKRELLYQKFEKAYIAYGIQIPLVYPKQYYAVSTQIRGIHTDLVLGENGSGLLRDIDNWSGASSDT